MSKYIALILSVLFILNNSAFAQLGRERVNIRLLDKQTSLPLESVQIVYPDGTVAGESNIKGVASLPGDVFAKHPFVIVTLAGYKVDSLREFKDVVYLQRLQATLQEVTVSSKTVKRVLHSAREYVVDYDFVDGMVLVASYSGGIKRKGKLFLLDKSGDTASLVVLPEVPQGLYQSCLGKPYCLGGSVLYSLLVDSGDINVDGKYDLAVLPYLQSCKLATPERFYYKIEDRWRFQVQYGYINAGDTAFRTMLDLTDKRAERSTMDEWDSIQVYLAMRQFSKAAQLAGMMHLRNKAAYSYVNPPIFFDGDKLVIFDFRKKEIRYLDKTGNPLHSVPMNFGWSSIQQVEVLKDPVKGSFYLHSWETDKDQTLAQLNMETGNLNYSVKIEKPFAIQMKVYDGSIFYLWQDPVGGGTQQLYVQQGLAR